MNITEQAKSKYNGKFPQQALSNSSKGRVWRAAHLEWASNNASFACAPVRNSTIHMKINYDLFAGKLHMDDVEAVINPEGLKENTPKEPIQHYPIINSKLELLRGEESKRVFDFRVVVTNPNAITETEEKKRNAVLMELQQLIASGSQNEEEFNQKLDKMFDFFTYEYQDMREVRANQLVNHYQKELDLPLKFNSGFMDAAIVGEEIYQINIEGGEPTVERLNPMKVRIYRSGYSNKVEDADVIVLEDYWQPGRILDVYHDAPLTKKDIDYIQNGANDLGSDEDRDPTKEFLPKQMITDVFTYTDEEGDEFVWDPLGVYTNSDLSPFDTAGNVRVLRMYWKSIRKIKKVKSYDPETGEEVFHLYNDSYVINENLGEEEEFYYINEAWEGTKIGEEIYVNMRPRVVQYNRLSNPSRCHFGIIGTIYNINDDKPYSFVDMMKQYNYMYDVTHDRLNKLMARNWGVIARLDLAKVPQGWDMEKWWYFATKMGIAVENSFNMAERSNVMVGGMNNANTGVINMSDGNTIQMYINFLEFLKMSMSEVVGITKQREGQVSNRETVGGVERATLQSSHITEWIFVQHENLKKRVIECLLETAKIAYKGRSVKFKYILSDGTERVASLDGDEFAEADYGLLVESSSGIQELGQKLEMLAQAGLQNQMISFSTVMKLYNSTSMAEKQRLVEKDERDMRERQAQAQQQQLEAQSQQAQLEAQMKQAEMEQKERMNMRDNETKLLIANLNSVDNDGIKEPEYSQEAKDKLAESIREFNEKIALEREKLALEKKKAADDIRLREKQINKNSKSTK